MVEPSLALAFSAGIITVATPCIIMILPPMLAGSVGSIFRPIAIVAGMSVTFTAIGAIFSTIGYVAGPSHDWLAGFASLLIIAFGMIFFVDGLHRKFVETMSIATNKIMNVLPFKKTDTEIQGGGLADAFVIGLSFGIIWLPCIGTIMGSILMFVLVTGNVLDGSLFLFAYSMGLATPMLAIAYSGKLIAARIKGIAKHGESLRKIAGIFMIILGMSMIIGYREMMMIHEWCKINWESLSTPLLRYLGLR